jgi:hypothetical protein
MIEKLTSQHIAEFDRYYHPTPQICSKLPDVKSVRDFTEIWIPTSDNKHNVFKMVQGNWKQTGTNL